MGKETKKLEKDLKNKLSQLKEDGERIGN